MKPTIILFIVILMLVCCKQNVGKIAGNTVKEEVLKESGALNEDKDKTGNFLVDGISYSGKSSMQFLGDKDKDQFSVVCQVGEPYTLLQVTFINRESAKGSLQPAEGFYIMEAGQAHVALSGTRIGNQEFVTQKESGGSIIVNGNKLFLKNLELFSLDGDTKTVNAEVGF